MKRAALLLLVATAPVSADPLVDALTRRDVAYLRARLPDDSARCTLGVVYLFRDDLTRAAHYLEGCGAARIAPAAAGWVRLAARALDERLRMSELAALEITTSPPGLLVSLDTVPGERFPTPALLWLPAGPHALRAGSAIVQVELRARTAAKAHLTLPPEPPPSATAPSVDDCSLQDPDTIVSCHAYDFEFGLAYDLIAAPCPRPWSFDRPLYPMTLIVRSLEDL